MDILCTSTVVRVVMLCVLNKWVDIRLSLFAICNRCLQTVDLLRASDDEVSGRRSEALREAEVGVDSECIATKSILSGKSSESWSLMVGEE